MTLAFLLLAGYGTFLCLNASTSVGGADSSGYFNASRMLLDGRTSEPARGMAELGLRQDQILIVNPLGYVPAARPESIASLYPPGFPLHVAAATVIPGLAKLPFFISPIAAVASIVLMFLLAREAGVSRLGSFCGAAVLAACPVLIFQAIQPMSDVVALAWSLATILLALKSQRSTPAAVLSGICFGIAWLVRPSSVVLLLPLALALPLRRWKSLAGFAAGAIPFLVFQLLYNYSAFGSYLQTGYAIEGLTNAFTTSGFFERFRDYLVWTARQFTPIMLIFWAGVVFATRAPVRTRLVMTAWFGSFLLFYSSYNVADAWWYTRFLLPAYPALIAGAFLFIEARLGTGRLRKAVPVSLAILSIVVGVRMTRTLEVLRTDEVQQKHRLAVEWLATQVQPDALVLSMEMSGAIKWYSELTPIRWDWLDEPTLEELAERARRIDKPFVALLMPHEIDEVNERFRGRFVRKADYEPFTLSVLDLPAHGHVDVLRESKIMGWAFDPDLTRGEREAPSMVRLVLRREDGLEVRGPWEKADLPRGDLVAAGVVKEETHAFVLDVAPLMKHTGVYEVMVEALNQPSGSPVTLEGRQMIRVP